MIFPICLQKYFAPFVLILAFLQLSFRSRVVAPMTAFRATSSCFICPTPARAFSRLNYFRLPYTFIFAAKILLFSHISKKFFFSIYFLPRFCYSSNGVRFYLRCFSPSRRANLSIPPVAPAECLPFPPRFVSSTCGAFGVYLRCFSPLTSRQLIGVPANL